jgi:fructose-1,6-bisphosphatase/inositol monophosphatase family enzyme
MRADADPLTIDPHLSDAELAAALVGEAGRLAARMRERGLTGEEKTSVSDLVTAADRAAEEFVVAVLRRARPDDGILGEEGADQESRSGRTWVIDPVDGTYNFVSGLQYWCSAVALHGGDGPIVGAVHQPSAGEIWLGGRGLPTTRNGQPVAPIEDHPLAVISFATYIHPNTLSDPDVLEPFLAMTEGAATPRVLGSGSVDLANVAAGRIGAWAQHSCPDWDWLPGQALVEAAGGTTDVIEHRRHRWHLAGGPRAVSELRQRLLST